MEEMRGHRWSWAGEIWVRTLSRVGSPSLSPRSALAPASQPASLPLPSFPLSPSPFSPCAPPPPARRPQPSASPAGPSPPSPGPPPPSPPPSLRHHPSAPSSQTPRPRSPTSTTSRGPTRPGLAGSHARSRRSMSARGGSSSSSPRLAGQGARRQPVRRSTRGRSRVRSLRPSLPLARSGQLVRVELGALSQSHSKADPFRSFPMLPRSTPSLASSSAAHSPPLPSPISSLRPPSDRVGPSPARPPRGPARERRRRPLGGPARTRRRGRRQGRRRKAGRRGRGRRPDRVRPPSSSRPLARLAVCVRRR